MEAVHDWPPLENATVDTGQERLRQVRSVAGLLREGPLRGASMPQACRDLQQDETHLAHQPVLVCVLRRQQQAWTGQLQVQRADAAQPVDGLEFLCRQQLSLGKCKLPS